ncbi:hypothetical protein IW152_006103 [Coemansia sp. BCRC 34962]|nr:hypothetical protein IW152_006103 [Coemansia sp. BCRC 34962]
MSVNMSSANPAYFTELPKPKLDLLSKDTATTSRLNTFVQIDNDFLQSTGRGRYPGHLAADFKLFGKPALLYRQVTQTLSNLFVQYELANEFLRSAIAVSREALSKCKTSYHDQEDNILPASRFRLAYLLLPFFEGKSLAKGWVVGTTLHAEVRFMPNGLKTRLCLPPTIPIANPDLARDPGVAV